MGEHSNVFLCLGLCDACPYAQARAMILPFTGRRRTSPKGGNRGVGRCRYEAQLWGFECSPVRSWRRCRHVAVARARSIPLVSEAACTLVMAVSASLDGEAAHDAAVRYREVAMESGQGGDGHAAARSGGGARIDGARANSCTTRMAAPQCGQTKIAEAGVVEACRVVTASGTCSSSRARARCCRRPALASKP